MSLGKVRLDVTPIVKYIQKMEKLQRSFEPSGKEALQATASKMEARVREAYLKGGHSNLPLSPGTIQKYMQGKRAGASPPITPKSKRTPFGPSLAALVQYRKSPKGARVFIKPGVPMSGGATSDGVALMNEFGETHTMVATARARTYLRALAMGVAGSDVLVRPVSRTPITIMIRIPPRPVWQVEFVRMLSRQPREFVTDFSKNIEKRTGFKVVFK